MSEHSLSKALLDANASRHCLSLAKLSKLPCWGHMHGPTDSATCFEGFQTLVHTSCIATLSQPQPQSAVQQLLADPKFSMMGPD